MNFRVRPFFVKWDGVVFASCPFAFGGKLAVELVEFSVGNLALVLQIVGVGNPPANPSSEVERHNDARQE
jgi:hypothetical protein